MQLTGDDGLEIRLPVPAGQHNVGVTFVREMFETEGLPNPVQLGRVISNDQVYMAVRTSARCRSADRMM